MVEEWCSNAVFYQQHLQIVQDIKYLGIFLDAKLLLNKHLQYGTIKAKKALMVTKEALGKSWELKLDTVTLAIYGSDKACQHRGEEVFKGCY